MTAVQAVRCNPSRIADPAIRAWVYAIKIMHFEAVDKQKLAQREAGRQSGEIPYNSARFGRLTTDAYQARTRAEYWREQFEQDTEAMKYKDAALMAVKTGYKGAIQHDG